MFNLIGRASAQTIPNQTWTFPNLNAWVVQGGSLGDLIQMLVNWFLIIAGAIAVIFLIYGGILYITAGGDAEKATKGRTAIVNAIIGVVIILLAFIIVQWVGNIVTRGTT